jgi:ribosomal-protein-alanine N-acetyltransferase
LERIRVATFDDLDAVVAIERVAFTDPPWSRNTFASLVGDPSVQFLVADVSRPVGTGPAARPSIGGYVVTWIVVDQADISNLAVAPDRRRRGLGRRLLEAAIAGVQGAGARTVFLEVRESNAAALHLYDSRGFAMIGRRRRYYRNPIEDALVLRLDLFGASTPSAAL